MSNGMSASMGLGVTGGVCFALLMSTTAQAQAQAPDSVAPGSPSPAAEKRPAQLEEVVVTADRKGYGKDLVQVGSFRGARAIDTPLTINVIPQEVLLSQQALGLLDALRNTAGVTTAQTSNVVYNNLAIRGIAVENRGNYRLNGSLPIINLTDLPLEDKDRVEALKGASALYYGFSTPSGIINLTMKRPTRQPLLEADVFGNDHGAVAGHVDAGGTYGMFGGRINLVRGSVDSGVDNTRGDRSLEAGAFDFKPFERVTFSLDVEHYTKTVNEPGIYTIVQPAPTVANLYPLVTLPPLTDLSTNFAPKWATNRSEATNVLGHVTWKITDAWSLSADVGDATLSRDRVLARLTPTNLATGEGNLVIGLQPNAHYENKNVRGELAGTFYTGPFLHEVLIGASRNVRDQYASASTAATCPGTTPTSPRVTCTQNFFFPRDIPETPLPTPTFVATRIDDTGYYVFDRVKFGEWLQVLGGVRQSEYEESSLDTGLTTFKASPLSISYGAVLKPRRWISLYGTYIEGLESTPAAPLTTVNASAQLPATESQQKEFGLKVEPHRGLLLQTAYFEIERTSTFTNSQNVYVQDGRAQYKGVELSLTGEVTRDLSIYASALRLDAKQISGAPTVINRNAAGVVTSVSPTLVGNEVENSAKTTWSVAGEYRFTDVIPGFSLSAGLYYTGRRAVNPLNTGFIPSYTLVDVGGAYRTELFKRALTFRLNVQNFTNERYFASAGGNLVAQGTPRTVRFSLSTTF